MARVRESIKPGWANQDLPDYFYTDTDYLKIIAFFVLHAFRPNRSSKGKSLSDYGWPKDVWRHSSSVGLREVLLYTADLHLRSQTYDSVTGEPLVMETFSSCQKLDDMSKACKLARVQHDFARTRNANRIAIYNSENNLMMSVFDHIRNAFAHGRFMIYNNEIVALESGKIVYDHDKKKNMFDVRARMILKKETLLQWITIIEAGFLDPNIVNEITEKRQLEKRKRKQSSKQGR